MSGMISADSRRLRAELVKPGGAQKVGFNAALSVSAKLAERPSVQDAGALPDGATPALAAVNQAIADAVAVVALPKGDFLVSAPPANPLGVRFEGPGRLLMPVTGGLQQLNSYVDDGKLFVGKEYLYRVYERMRLGFVTPIKAFVYGDSTVAGDAATGPFYVQNLLPLMAQRIGLPVPLSVANRGVGGTRVGDLNALPDLAVDTDLFIIKYGINDGANADATRLATFSSTLRAKLAAIRAAQYGGYATLAIVLVGPTSTSDTPNGRDERWYEQLRGVYLQAARDFKCCYFDAYAYMKDARGAATLWMDDPFGDGRAIHPKDLMYQAIWGALMRHMFPSDEVAVWRINSVSNVHSSVIIPGEPNIPSNYPYGITLYRATAAAGWPEDGVVLTHRSVDGAAMQQLFPYTPGRAVVCTRVANTAANSWNIWTGRRVAVPLLNGWAAYDQATYDSPTAVLGAEGVCTLSMHIAGGAVAAGTQIASVPAGMLPAKSVGPFPCVLGLVGSTAMGGVLVRADGAVLAASALNAALTSVQISFRVA